MKKHPIDVAVTALGSFAALAQLLGVTKAAVHQWKDVTRQVPLEHCTAIEQAAEGKVTRRDLRPLDWWLIWPELIDADHPAPQKSAPEASREVV